LGAGLQAPQQVVSTCDRARARVGAYGTGRIGSEPIACVGGSGCTGQSGAISCRRQGVVKGIIGIAGDIIERIDIVALSSERVFSRIRELVGAFAGARLRADEVPERVVAGFLGALKTVGRRG